MKLSLRIIPIALLLLLAGCQLPGQARGETPVTPTRPPTIAHPATSRPAPTVTRPPTPPATVDPARLDESFVSGDGVLTFRYPSSWTIQDESAGQEILVSARSPTAEQAGRFVVNLLPVAHALAEEELHALADTYLRNLLGEQYDPATTRYREAGDRLIATYVDQIRGEARRFELRFTPHPPLYEVLILIAPEQDWQRSVPLLDTMARSLTVAPEGRDELPAPTPASTTRVREGLGVQNSSHFTAATGSLYFVGEVVNRSEHAYEDVQVTIVLLDEAGEELARERWAIPRRLLPAGETSPLLVIFDLPPEGWTTTRARVDALPATFYPGRVVTDFEVSAVEPFDPPFADYGLQGEIRNTGEAARFVEIIGTLYDPQSGVLAVETVTLERELLPPGEQVPFHLLFYGVVDEVASHQILVEGVKRSDSD